jgi:uncharacterized damage-inducible protein DinB
MPMQYEIVTIPDSIVPRASNALLQHLLDTYASEINKVAAVWRVFHDDQLSYRPHERSMTVEDVLKHQLLSERRFFGEFLGGSEPPPAQLLPSERSVSSYIDRLRDLAVPRLAFVATRPDAWWVERVTFFDVERERIWIFWRRVLHTAHHRTQLSVYLRLLNRPVPPTYGPTADATWSGADPTRSVEAAGRS